MKSATLQPFNAAVVAIACTLLVLELDAPDKAELSALVNDLDLFLAHYNSFCLIYLLWYMHAKEIERVDTVSARVVLLNNFWLLFITFVPFATNWVEAYPNETAPQLVIICCFSFCYILNNWIIKILKKDHPDITFSKKSAFKERVPIYILLAIAFINSFFFPMFNVGIIFLITLFFIYWLFKTNKSDVRL